MYVHDVGSSNAYCVVWLRDAVTPRVTSCRWLAALLPVLPAILFFVGCEGSCMQVQPWVRNLHDSTRPRVLVEFYLFWLQDQSSKHLPVALDDSIP